jgi:predicted dehydrogenase
MLDRLLIVGFGSIGKRHLRLAKLLMPKCKIILLRHQAMKTPPDPAVDYCASSLKDAIALHPQAAVIAGPATFHIDMALPLARAGIHLLIEKPISSNSKKIDALLTTCKKNKVTLMTGYNMRFLPSLQFFRQLVLEQRVGNIFSVRAEVGQYLPSWRPGTDYQNNVSAQAKLGGGVLLELSHELDYLRWIFGEVAWVSAIASKQSRLEIDVEDTAHLLMGFISKEKGQKQIIASLNMDFIRHDSCRTCTVIGENGSLRWNAIEAKVEIFEPGADGWQTLNTFTQQRDSSYISEWEHFLDCIEKKAAPLITGQDGLAVVKIIEAAKASSLKKKLIPLKKKKKKS